MPSDPRLEELIRRHFEARLEPRERAELEAILRRDAAARERLAAAALDELALAEALGCGIPEIELPRSGRRFPRLGWLAAAAALVLGLTLLAVFSRRAASEDELVRVLAGQLVERPLEGPPGQRQLLAAAGARLEIAGTLVHCRERTHLLLSPPPPGDAVPAIDRERPRLELLAGHLSIATRPGSPGLRIQTPAGVLRDIGTRFDLRLSQEGTETMFTPPRAGLGSLVSILVLAGLVQFQPQDAPEHVQTLGPQEGELSLARDGSIGTALDREGLAQVRRRGSERWRLLREKARLMPGDWVRTGQRGANAAVLRLANQARLTLGPGALVEIVGTGELKLSAGELALRLPEGVQLRVAGPGGKRVEARGAQVLRARGAELAVLDHTPAWLSGYEGDRSTEALGALLADVDGRQVPLSMGYHKVSVDIRDQIARTVVEESFVNHTNAVLEGVFYFPLPADASISGFAMWVGNEKVHGEIVEKQRAREIYETILREKRDPGLLEWTGGNMFKARVYPITGSKRIQITYTQVLPKRGDTYRYHYALRSDLTRLTPLERLEIGVTISSAEGIAGLECPTHPCRIQLGEHAASAEFSAQEIVPQRDFELRVKTTPASARARFLPHRRGEEGYFLLLFDAPPAPTGDEALATAPRDVVFLLDTSGSMAGRARELQLAALEALLAGLGPRDRFQLATVDTEVRWAFDGYRGNTAALREEALAFFERRYPLGWSDLAAGFETVFASASATTQIVYLGDGIVSKGERDPAALVARLERAHRGRGAVHTIALGSTSEALVMRGLARLGGGSARAIGDGDDPAAVSEQLLEELAQPGVRDLQVAFEGIDAAAVHPRTLPNRTLPNLPAGTQAILVGRYDPASARGAGRALIRGSYRGTVIAAEAPIELAGAAQGNSFIPRMWARRHLDHLLEQGSSQAIRDRIITLSEDFQIITPQTSFLVLESEADRERFQVEKRFRMRDGEAFFAEGREDARFELRRQQMQLARQWRRELRQRFLKSIEHMGRERMANFGQEPARQGPQGAWAYGENFSLATRYYDDGLDGSVAYDKRAQSEERMTEFELASGDVDADADMAMDHISDFDVQLAQSASIPMLADLPMSPGFFPMAKSRRASRLPESVVRADSYGLAAGGYFNRGDGDIRGRYENSFSRSMGRRRTPSGLAQLFPALPRAAQRLQASWPPEVMELLARLDRRAWIAAQERGLAIRTARTARDHRGRELDTASAEHLIAAQSWWTTAAHAPGDGARHDWLAKGWRGARVDTWLLGSQREVADGDASAWSAPFGLWFDSLARTHAGYLPALEDADEGLQRLVLRTADPGGWRLELLVDPGRAAILEVRRFRAEELVATTRFEELFERGGAWWPARVVERDAAGRLVRETRVELESLAPDAFERLLAERLAHPATALIAGELPEDLRAARQAVRDGSAGFEARFLLVLAAAAEQRWERAAPHLAAIEELIRGKLGAPRLKLAALLAQRRGAEVRELLGSMAAALVAAREGVQPGERQRAVDLYQASSSLGAHERLALLDGLRAVYERQARFEPLRLWYDQRLELLKSANRVLEHRALLTALCARYPFVSSDHTALANALAALGQTDAALAHIERALEEHAPWNDGETSQLRGSAVAILMAARRLAEAINYLERWQQLAPAQLSTGLYEQYISAHYMLGREQRGDELIATWLAAGMVAAPDKAQRLRLDAAIEHGLGRGWSMWRSRFEERWAAPMAQVARFFARHPRHASLAGRIVTNRHYRETMDCQTVLAELHRALLEKLDELSDRQVADYLEWLRNANYRSSTGREDWEAICEALLARWIRRGADDPLDQVGRALQGCGTAEQKQRYHRQRVAVAGDPQQLSTARKALFDALLSADWSAANERELSELIPLLGASNAPAGAKSADADLAAQLHALWRFTTAMPARRAGAAIAAREDTTELTRRALKEAREEATQRGRAAVAETLRALEERVSHEPLRPWLALERIYLQAKAGAEVAALDTTTWNLLRARLAASSGANAMPAERELALRGLATLAWMVLFPDDGETRVDTLLEFLGEQVAAGQKELFDAREWKANLLLGLDRFAPLAAELRSGYGTGERYEQMPWGRALAYLLAEIGRLDEALALLAHVDGFEELGAGDYRTMAAWYTALGDQDGEQAARRRAWEAMGEDAISSWLDRQYYRYRGNATTVPEELDPEIPRALVVLLRKAQHPGNRMWYPRWFYQNTRDFRLLAAIAEGAIGHSSQAIYPFLEEVNGILVKLQEEATLDRLVAVIERLRADWPAPADRRALFLLEFLARNRALAQASGTADHITAVLNSMRAAWKGSWAAGEGPQMAKLLAALDDLKHDALRDELFRQLAELQRLADPRSDDRFAIATHRAKALWNNARREEAVRIGAAALAAARSAGEDMLPERHFSAYDTHLDRLRASAAYRGAEELLLGDLARPYTETRRRWLERELLGHYASALRAEATTGIGEGRELYLALEKRYDDALARRTDSGHLRQLVSLRCTLWKQIHAGADYTEMPPRLLDFAFSKLPALLARYHFQDAQPVVNTVAGCLHEISGARMAVEFLVTRAENEPQWLALGNSDFWSYNAWLLGKYRADAGRLPAEIERRMLAIVIAELRADLSSGRARTRYLYQRSSHFWNAKRGAFLEAAQGVLAERTDNPRIVLYIAEYLADGLGQLAPAIDALLAAHRRGILPLPARQQLCHYLHRARRWGESIAILRAMIGERAEELGYRTLLMAALFHTNAADELVRTLDAADAYFHQEKRWTESVIAALGEACLNSELFERAVAYYREAINLHTRGKADRGVGNSRLGPYYRNLAAALSGLGRTAEAVDACAGAIVAWGKANHRRGEALSQLEKILANAGDLDAYAATLEAEVTKSGLENPIIRRALGRVYLQKKRPTPAVVHLEAAVQASPEDLELQRLLVQAYDAAGRRAEGTRQLLAHAQASARTLALFSDLGKRFAEAENPTESERAYTSIVEAKPAESESHQLLAAIREVQGDLRAALHHWREVDAIRSREPTGQIGALRNLIALRDWPAARSAWDALRSKTWPARFDDEMKTAAELARKIPR